MRTREERVKNKVIQVMKKIKRMSDSKDIDYTMDELVISKKLSIKIECLRGNEKDFTDENGKVLSIGNYGEVISFDIYAIQNEKEIDAISGLFVLGDKGQIAEAVKYLLNCYMWGSEVRFA